MEEHSACVAVTCFLYLTGHIPLLPVLSPSTLSVTILSSVFRSPSWPLAVEPPMERHCTCMRHCIAHRPPDPRSGIIIPTAASSQFGLTDSLQRWLTPSTGHARQRRGDNRGEVSRPVCLWCDTFATNCTCWGASLGVWISDWWNVVTAVFRCEGSWPVCKRTWRCGGKHARGKMQWRFLLIW